MTTKQEKTPGDQCTNPPSSTFHMQNEQPVICPLVSRALGFSFCFQHLLEDTLEREGKRIYTLHCLNASASVDVNPIQTPETSKTNAEPFTLGTFQHPGDFVTLSKSASELY